MSGTVQTYAVYETSGGLVVNAIAWDGVAAFPLPAGCASVADPTGKWPIGSTYQASAS